MKRFVSLFIAVMLLVIAVAPAAAQGPGEGGTIFISNDTDDPDTFNPLIYTDNVSSQIFGRLYPNMIGFNPDKGVPEAGFKDSMATDWSFDETGTILTVNLRQDMYWSDGVQVTAKDLIWATDALRSGLLEGPRGLNMYEALDDGTAGSGSVVSIDYVDDFTVQVTFNRADCQAINDLFDYFLPSHIFEEDFGDDIATMNEDRRYYPGVSALAWMDPDLVPGDRISMIPNQDYVDADLGYVSPGEWVLLGVPDGDVALERFRAGEITIETIPGDKQADFENDPDFQTYRRNARGYSFIAFNMANPENPQPAYDEDGNPAEQEPHPILADKLVRQAIVHAVDVDALIENTLDGNAIRVGTPSIPTMWDFDPDRLATFDPALAMELLDEAGWVMEEGNEWRVCRGCAYAEEGSEMALTLNAREGVGESYENELQFEAQNMRDVGINVEVSFIDWGSAFIPALLGQTFDMARLSWNVALPLDPDNTGIFTSQDDIPGAGYNFVSYINPELDQLYKDARDPALTDGCTIEGRLPYYERANEIFFDELPYMFLWNTLSMAAAQGWLENWDPATFSDTWQEDAWIAIAPE